MASEAARTASRLVAGVLAGLMMLEPLHAAAYALGSPHPVRVPLRGSHLGTSCQDLFREHCVRELPVEPLLMSLLLVAAAAACWLGCLRGQRSLLLAGSAVALVWWIAPFARELLTSEAGTLAFVASGWWARILVGLAFALLLAWAASLQPRPRPSPAP